MYNNTFKRVLAYIFDFLLVSVVVAMFSELSLINPYFDEYNDISNKYLETPPKSDFVNMYNIFFLFTINFLPFISTFNTFN